MRLEATADRRLLRHVDEPDRAWNEADRTILRGVRRFIFGGFVGTSAGLGTCIRARALHLLSARGMPEVVIIQIPGDSADAGLLGAVSALSAREE